MTTETNVVPGTDSSVRDVLDKAQACYDGTRDRLSNHAHRAADATQNYVKENPWQVLGGAAVAGFLIGFLLSRR